MHIPVLPRILMPAHTCTLTGCFALLKLWHHHIVKMTCRGLFLGGSPSLRQHHCLCVSSWTLHSSVKITLEKLSLLCSRAKSSLFCLLTSHMSWQYALSLSVHPNDVLQQRMVRRFRVYPMVVNRTCSWLAVVSSSRSICSLTILLTSGVITVLPQPAKRWCLEQCISLISQINAFSFTCSYKAFN